MFFTNNTWNNTGTFVSGFDFSLSNGRDANIEIVNNAGIADHNPKCKINVIDNAEVTAVTSSLTKISWTDASDSIFTVKWAVDHNKITYLPKNTKDVVIHILGSVSVPTASANKNITIGIRKGGAGSLYEAITIRVPSGFLATTSIVQFATVVYLQNVSQNNYFELYANTSSGTDNLTFSDINIYATSE